MNECEHLTDGNCSVASRIAAEPVPANPKSCSVCLGCSNPKSPNLATIGLARVTLKGRGKPFEHLYPDDVRAAIELRRESAAAAQGPVLADGLGAEFAKNLPWLDAYEPACDCFSFLQVINRWGCEKAIAEKERIARWFLGVAAQLGVATSADEIELALFRAAAAINLRNRRSAEDWPFVFTYYAAGAVGDELRYAIRSVLRWQPGARIIVVGDRPEWYRGEFWPKPRIPTTDYHAFRDCYSKLLMAAERLPRFIWHMDDIYWIKPFAMSEAACPKYVRHVSQAKFYKWRPKNAWGKTRMHAYRWLLEHNRPTYDFAAHLPQPIVSEKFLVTEAEAQLMTTRYRNWECLYYNTHHSAEAQDWGRRYLRVSRTRASINTRHKVLNHTHSQFTGAVQTFLAELLPDPCDLERK